MKYAPIVLFVYNRPWHTLQTVEALQRCELVTKSDLYIFADGPKSNATEEQKAKISEVRQYIRTIYGFHSVTIEESKSNKGLANSVISGVTKVIEKHGRVIVVEDDIVAHPFFLRFMNEALEFYEHDSRIYMIGGCRLKFKIPWWYTHNVYILHRSCSWGWATWKDRWSMSDWDVSDYNTFIKSQKEIDLFCRGGRDMIHLLQQQIEGIIDSWAIRWDYCMYKHDGYCLWPKYSLVRNIGFDNSGIHCGNDSKIKIPPKKNVSNNFVRDISANNTLEKSFYKFCDPAPQISFARRVRKNTKHFSKKNTGSKMYLKRIIRRMLRCLTQKGQANEKPTNNNLKKYSKIGNSICNDVNIRLEDPEDGRTYLTIGDDCIVSGNYIFESKSGKVEIGQHCYIGYSTFISRSNISIGNNVTIAWGCTIYDHNSHSLDFLERRKDIDDELFCLRNGQSTYKNKNWDSVKSSPITICDDAWIGMNCIILKGVTIGERAVVGAGSVVTKDVPAWTVAAGNPAEVVKTLVQ